LFFFLHLTKEAAMSELATIEKIPVNEVQLSDAERQPCEVWTRVMGYHRPVASFNVGKQGEHNERRFFAEPGRVPRSSC
jgi:hypothetical protein